MTSIYLLATSFTPRRSLVRSQYRPPSSAAGSDHGTGLFLSSGRKRQQRSCKPVAELTERVTGGIGRGLGSPAGDVPWVPRNLGSSCPPLSVLLRRIGDVTPTHANALSGCPGGAVRGGCRWSRTIPPPRRRQSRSPATTRMSLSPVAAAGNELPAWDQRHKCTSGRFSEVRSGGRGIRTHGDVAVTMVFKTIAIGH